MKSLGNFKRGDTFAFYGILTDPTTLLPVDIDPTLILSQVRNADGKLYATLNVTASGTAGKYLFQTSKTVTALWPSSMNGVTLYVDIEFTVNEITSSSETFSVNVIQDISKQTV